VYDIVEYATGNTYDPDDAALFQCNTPSNTTYYCNPALDMLEESALVAQDKSPRRQIYASIQRVLARDVPYAYLYSPKYSFAAVNELKGFAPSPLSAIWNAYQWRLH